MRSQYLLAIALFSAAELLASGCATHAYYLARTGIIRSRPPGGRLPAMYVVDDSISSNAPCGTASVFTFGPELRVVSRNGAPADTSALVVGRRVSVFLTQNTMILESCPSKAYAAKVVLR